MAIAYLGLGTNLGNKDENLNGAVEYIRERVGRINSLSAFYVTEPWGFKSENSFLNAVCSVATDISPIELLYITKEIEKEMGRNKKSVDKIYSDRIIDIDILLYDDLIMQSEELTIPHPIMTERDFVMIPLAEIAPELVHPVLKKKMKEFLK
ncbi:2-amino-4-hydroxy-6-hydroxymethyldihydropteridine diphosphokinase [Phocaeicola paurosaccharolyticus]|jgi:2-amino-4-hydroxy-6-hydroxymethyldihydropteridine diphosphokinase|nr:2-amino-4-hydroxy-6-hydroxymethyldihydropteridine diphosphokinase [Phocaeicola paurosaccharolyticus]